MEERVRGLLGTRNVQYPGWQVHRTIIHWSIFLPGFLREARWKRSLEFRAREPHTPYVSADLRVLLESLEPWGIFPAEKITGFSSVLFSKGGVKWDNNNSISIVSALLLSENSISSSKCNGVSVSPGPQTFELLKIFPVTFYNTIFVLVFSSGIKKRVI